MYSENSKFVWIGIVGVLVIVMWNVFLIARDLQISILEAIR